jgi:hypothetical protein
VGGTLDALAAQQGEVIMRRLATESCTVARAALADRPPVPPLPLRAWLGRVEEALLRGVRLRTAKETQATAELRLLADELDSVAEQIRGALGIPAKIR